MLPFVNRRPLVLAVLAALGVATLAACDAGDPDPGPFVPPADEVVAGVNLDALFQAPTPGEQDATRAAFAQRDRALAGAYRFELVEERAGLDGAELLVYRARDAESGTVLFHGVVRLPLRATGDGRARPLVLVLDDGTDGASADLLTSDTLPVQASLRDDLVLALLAYRGEPLEAGGARYDSEAAPSPYDRDVDDALAFLTFARGLGVDVEFLVDGARLGVIGLGRGGGTALLTEARGGPYTLVVDLAGPTDLFLGTFRTRVRDLLRGEGGGRFPGIDALADAIVFPLRDSALTLEEARLALLARSARYFTAPPPFIAAVHGEFDGVVPVEHGRVLDLRDPDQGGASAVYLELPDADHTSILRQGKTINLVSTLLRDRFSL
ncbi:MAG: hypothetical protein R3181_00620 [Rubricoccaceae bacterium]|nr:hypothetical protein [Rubricoccaceae bacterium]